jgi:hypothetical protein
MSKEDEKWKLGDLNKSGIYILPMLGFKDTQFWSKFTMPQCQFRNCFIGDNIKGTKNRILLVYEFSSNTSYKNFENTLRKHELFEEDFEFGSHHTVFVFRVPEEYKKDYNLIIVGKYSEISKTYKDHIIDFHSFVADSETFGILYKTGKRKEQLEAIINEGLPKFYWTIIPPFIELEEGFSEIEVLQPENVNNDNKLIK